MPVTAEQLFGGPMPYGTEQEGQQATPDPVRIASGDQGVISESPVLWWTGMLMLLVAWYIIVR